MPITPTKSKMFSFDKRFTYSYCPCLQGYFQTLTATILFQEVRSQKPINHFMLQMVNLELNFFNQI